MRSFAACSLGAALGPLLTSYLSQTQGGFNSVFYMLYASSLAAAVLLSRLVINEVPLSRQTTLSPSQVNKPRLACADIYLPWDLPGGLARKARNEA